MSRIELRLVFSKFEAESPALEFGEHSVHGSMS